jgi:hypothetical protein
MNKKGFKLNVLGFISIETEDITFNQQIIIMVVVILFMIIIILLLKIYAITALSMSSVIKKASAVKNLFKSRSP